MDSAAARRSGTVLVVAAIVLVALNQRAPITVVGPVVEEIRRHVDISATAAGFVTTLPVLAFGVASGFAASAGRRFGLEPVLTAGVLVLAGGLVARAVPSIAMLYVGAALIGVGIAFANVLTPALIKRDFPGQLGTMTAVYSAMLGVSAAIGAGAAVPLATETFLDWRGALAVWIVPTLLAAAVLGALTRRGAGGYPEPAGALPGRVFLRSRLAWSITAFFGLQSMAFFVSVAWLPAILIDDGLSVAAAGNLSFLFQVSGIAALLLVPGLAARARDQRALVVGMCVLATAGVAGLLWVSPTAVALWIFLLGFGQSTGLALALMFIVLRTRNSDDASTLSGVSQAAGYSIAAIGPLVAGLMHDATSGWTLVLLSLAAVYAMLLVFGFEAGRTAVIGDEP